MKTAYIVYAMFTQCLRNVFVELTGVLFASCAVYKPRDCAEILALGSNTSRVYSIYIGVEQRPLSVFCDMTTTSGGWTVGLMIMIDDS